MRRRVGGRISASPAVVARPASESEPPMNDPKISGIAPLNLKDPSLFRQQCYIDRKRANTNGGKSIPVNNPATGEILGTWPNMRAADTRRPIDPAGAAIPAPPVQTATEPASLLP